LEMIPTPHPKSISRTLKCPCSQTFLFHYHFQPTIIHHPRKTQAKQASTQTPSNMDFIRDEIEEAEIQRMEREEYDYDDDREEFRDIERDLEEREWDREREREYERERYDDDNYF